MGTGGAALASFSAVELGKEGWLGCWQHGHLLVLRSVATGQRLIWWICHPYSEDEAFPLQPRENSGSSGHLHVVELPALSCCFSCLDPCATLFLISPSLHCSSLFTYVAGSEVLELNGTLPCPADSLHVGRQGDLRQSYSAYLSVALDPPVPRVNSAHSCFWGFSCYFLSQFFSC